MTDPQRVPLAQPRGSSPAQVRPPSPAQQAFQQLRLQVDNRQFRESLAATVPREQRTTGYIERLCELLVTAVRDNNDLLNADRASLLRAVKRVAKTGLPIGAGGYHLLPFKGQVQESLDYRGALTLVRRSQLVKKVSAHVVRENDRCRVRLGTDESIEHEVPISGRGDWLAVYAVAVVAGVDTPEIELMERAEIEKIRELAPSKNSPAWKNFPDEMARKVCLKRLCKRLPLEDPDALRDLDDGGRETVDASPDMVSLPAPGRPVPVPDPEPEPSPPEPEPPPAAAQEKEQPAPAAAAGPGAVDRTSPPAFADE
jgi:phage RecT family recombinase